MVIVFIVINFELFVMLFIIVVLLCLNNQHRNTIVVYVIDNTIVCGDMARIGNVLSASLEYSIVYIISYRSISASLLEYGMKWFRL
jgi:hypothetical protein